MKKLLIICFVALGALTCASSEAQAQQPGFYGFAPFGFYQPYGARYGSSLQTPPYFAINPPVYYGARYARPYGMSPFAAPPMVNAPASYRGRNEAQFYQPKRPLAGSYCPNPYLSSGATQSVNQVVKGQVRANPFVDGAAEQLVSEVH